MNITTISQVIVSIIIIGLILIQEKSSGMSGVFGGSGTEGGVYQQRRGLEKMIFIGTIVCTIIFAGLSIAHLIL
ncbi:MAG: preprotein translocase subunit SecG [bacterium]